MLLFFQPPDKQSLIACSVTTHDNVRRRLSVCDSEVEEVEGAGGGGGGAAGGAHFQSGGTVSAAVGAFRGSGGQRSASGNPRKHRVLGNEAGRRR